MKLLSIDIGTTHCKAGLFTEEGDAEKIVVLPNIKYYDRNGYPYYKPEQLWQTIVTCIKDVLIENKEVISAIGITGMAETGLLLDLKTGQPKTDFIPWFSKCAEKEAEMICKEDDPFLRFCKTGLRSSYKYGLAKLLWLKKQDSSIFKDAIWLSAPDYIAYRITGTIKTDYTLAQRTFAFRIDQKVWDFEWLAHFGLPKEIFPEALPSGTKVGETNQEELIRLGIAFGTPVAISGHDHVCASVAVGAINPGTVFNSIGTAETLVGTLKERQLGKKEFQSGLSFGCHVLKKRFFWIGGIQSSGGSVEWLRVLLSDVKLTYEQVQRLSSSTREGPTGILYYPYLAGAGAPLPDSAAKAAFIGLTASHKKEDILKAVFEGISFEIESIRRAAEQVIELPIRKMFVVGGGTKNRYWMQIKSDVTNCCLSIPPVSEATLLGAAITAGIGCGIYKDENEMVTILSQGETTEIYPNQTFHQRYKTLYECGYLQLQQALRKFYHIQQTVFSTEKENLVK
ncbi:carbohydrate kinase [Parageobacillus sp. VR-IP]|uniref:FGGY-family carbohydrate kinase n=1 Tax=Parageobacillus sp. VR-IP TaxID=2742205 RepID=UPI00158272B9|nr:FGGY family carbohydrate kinase [Parageobacillus sp. VR-IP]NUK30258.1 carbohydrate kinase [Parageobacillus sp. VR-IP]